MDQDRLIAIGSYDDWDEAPMRREFDLHRIPDLGALDALPAEAMRARAVAYKGHIRFGGDEMDRLPDLKLIANYGVGVDAIDIDAASARGIRVTNTPDVLTDDVADLAVALWIVQARRMVEADAWVRGDEWTTGAFPLQRRASGRRAGILGLGRIGHAIAGRLAAFRCDIHYWSRSRKDTPGWTFHADPIDLAREVDDLFVALVGGAGTEGFVGAGMLEALGRDGVIVNISRGSVIDEGALLDALETRVIRGAGLDVFVSEPEPDPRFRALDNVVLQPHMGSGTIETRRRMGQLQRDNIMAHFAGAPLKTPVN